ncbi:DNA-methyltransferase [Anaeromicropila herbilytica]|uniref:DNA-methyltransferase n=1 Tax=Anaeromicropila herbilytica TaxID=2785025 RepID=UPI00232A1200|nr:site-specific DNA-methyltransferase [Anaeromicropila herbilytica]
MENVEGIINGIRWRTFNGDCRKILKDYIKAESIDCIFTSPPYYNLRSYGDKVRVDGNEGKWKYSNRKIATKDEIGIACNYEKYLSDLSEVFSVCYRVLKKDKFMFINIGNKHVDRECIDYSFDLITIAKHIGFVHCDIIIWIKKNSPPPGNHKEIYLGNGWEYILMFAKGKSYKINEDKYIDTGSLFKCKQCGSDDIVHFKSKPNYFFSNVGCFGNAKKKNSHPAPFPETVPRFCLAIGAKEHELILDPFVGSGTTLKVALDMHINCIGCELISKLYSDLIENLEKISKF